MKSKKDYISMLNNLGNSLSREELKSLAEFGGEDFIVTDFWKFY